MVKHNFYVVIYYLLNCVDELTIDKLNEYFCVLENVSGVLHDGKRDVPIKHCKANASSWAPAELKDLVARRRGTPGLR